MSYPSLTPLNSPHLFSPVSTTMAANNKLLTIPHLSTNNKKDKNDNVAITNLVVNNNVVKSDYPLAASNSLVPSQHLAINQSLVPLKPLVPSQKVASHPLLDSVIASHNTAPIGLFDSGLGGLSVYRHLKKVLPDERYVYYADILNVPYGNRVPHSIVELTVSAVHWLVTMGCKLIVIACNSASAHALSIVRNQYPHIPIVGLVPALKPAVLQSQTRRVAVLATKATIEGTLLNQVIADYATPNKVTVIKHFNPSLVPWVEQGMPTTSETAAQLLNMLHKFAKQQVDYLVLGCTHYPFFRDFLTTEVAMQDLGITIIDSGAAIANRVQHILHTKNLQIDPKEQGTTIATQLSHIPISTRVDDTLNGDTTVNNKSMNTQCDTADLNVNDLYVDSIDCKSHDRSVDNLAKLGFYVTDCNKDIEEIKRLVRQLVNIPMTVDF